MKVLWTFDPFDKNKELHLFGKKLLSSLFDKTDCLEVIYVASNAQAELATSFSIPVEKRYSDYPKKIIKNQLKKILLKKLHIEILFEKSLSLTSIVKKLVDYATMQSVDLVVIATNSKRNLPRFILGSFAETMVHISKCDLLTYHQKTKFNSEKPFNIIYAHDFSPKGTKGLERLLVYIKKWNSYLTIVHVPIPNAGVDLNEYQVSPKKHIVQIEKLIEKSKIKFKIHLEFKIQPISETILSITKKTNGSIIAVTAQSNKLQALLGGSITRQILRNSSVPTLILKV